jgi:hypothetical protein
LNRDIPIEQLCHAQRHKCRIYATGSSNLLFDHQLSRLTDDSLPYYEDFEQKPRVYAEDCLIDEHLLRVCILLCSRIVGSF